MVYSFNKQPGSSIHDPACVSQPVTYELNIRPLFHCGFVLVQCIFQFES